MERTNDSCQHSGLCSCRTRWPSSVIYWVDWSDTNCYEFRKIVTLLQAYNLFPLSAYHLYGKPGNSGENSNGTVHPVEIFRKKGNTFRGITFFPFLPKRPKFSVPFVWITSARLHVERKRKIYRYFVNGTTQSRSCFRCEKNTSTIWRKFFTDISVLMVSTPCLLSFVCQNASFKSRLLFWLWFHVI